MRFELTATEQRHEGRCPHCDKSVDLILMRPEASASPAMRHETILACPSCRRLSVPAGLVKRAAGLILLVPFGVILLAGFGAAIYLVVAMLSEGVFSVGFGLVAAILLGACSFGLVKVSRSLRRLLQANALLPLVGDGDHHVFQGSL